MPPPELSANATPVSAPIRSPLRLEECPYTDCRSRGADPMHALCELAPGYQLLTTPARRVISRHKCRWCYRKSYVVPKSG